MKSITKIVCILAIVVVLLLVAFYGRKAIIFNNYRKAQEKFSKSVNFYVRDAEENGITDTYRSGSKALVINYSDIKRIAYWDEKEVINYTEYELEGNEKETIKEAKVRTRDKSLGDTVLPILTDDSFKLESTYDAIMAAFKYKISNAKVDNYNCYEFKIDNKFYIYVNKEDYFKIREDNYSVENTVIDYKVEGITDEMVLKPSLSGYKVTNLDEE